MPDRSGGRSLVVDGLNVIGSRPDGWWRDRPAAMRRLVDALGGLRRADHDPVTVVFDGPVRQELVERAPPGVEVRFAGRAGRDAADDRITELVAGAEEAGALEVVTSDRDLAARVTELGGRVSGAGSFWRRLDAAGGG
jgi:predicted RNA-binding protein with PIN domain